MAKHHDGIVTDKLTISLNTVIRTVHSLVAHHENMLSGNYDKSKTSDVSAADLEEVERLIEMAKDYCTR